MIRQPVVAGQFYPENTRSLEQQVRGMMRRTGETVRAIGAVSPHAGYVYSGPVAGATLCRMTPQKTYFILGPNHTGRGARFSVDKAAAWQTPLGRVELDRPLIDALLASSDMITSDSDAHAFEHSIEVQLPFLQTFQKEFTLVPMVIGSAGPREYRSVGKSIAETIRRSKRQNDITIIASSDMTHYEPQELAKEKDRKAIDAILSLDEEELLKRVERLNISMCGYAPTYVMLVAAKELGATTAELVSYQTSGDTSGDYTSVVGYAGVIIT